MAGARSREEVFGAAIVAALIALALAFGAQRGRHAVPVTIRGGEVTELGGPIARFAWSPATGRIDVTSSDGRSRAELEMSLVVDGIERPLVGIRKGDIQLRDKTTLAGSFPIEIGDDKIADAVGTLELRMDPASDLLTASLVVMPEVGSIEHKYALRIGLAPEGREVFVPGAGGVNDVGNVEARTVVVDDDAHPFALVSTQGALAVSEVPPETDQPGAQPRLQITTRTEVAAERAAGVAGKPARLDLGMLVGVSSRDLWGRLYRILRAPVAKVTGVVTGTHERAHVIALDEEGRAQLRVVTDPQGHFALEAPTTAVQWYAVLEAAHVSAPVRYAPGSNAELKLDVSPGGELHIRILDGDTNQPIIARLMFKGVEGALDPSFGPDYRGSGAGPLMDVVDGEITTPLPAGKYRVSATKGIEWSIDSEIVEVTSGRAKPVDLVLRHVIPTPGLLGCDLHVHARPSFDSPVLVEDRVMSLISAGIDFAVPTEHNLVGDYAPAIEVLHTGKQLATVTGVEITTYNPRFGHFGVFPYPPGPVPPFKGTTAAGVFAGAKRGDPNRVFQVNHPRMQMGIGYFNIAGFDPKSGARGAGMRTDFDTLEVYNGYELARRALTERVLDDWFALLNLGKHIAATGSSDSHRIQYQWAGYPRTYAAVDPKQAGDTGLPIDTTAVVAAIKKGRGFVTSGPMLEIELGSEGKTARPGDDLPVPKGGSVTAHLRVRAAPWIDVTSIEVLAGTPSPPPPPPKPAPSGSASPTPHPPPALPAGQTTSVFKSAIPARPSVMGKEEGTLDEAAARTIRYDNDVSIKLPDGARWIVIMVKGERTLDDALPFMPIQPLGFTNPIWLAR